MKATIKMETFRLGGLGVSLLPKTEAKTDAKQMKNSCQLYSFALF